MPARPAWPLRKTADGKLATVEQDSPEDIAQCVLAIARTRPGQRIDAPALGVDPRQLLFHERPLRLEQVRETIARHEPRATVTVVEVEPLVADALAQAAAELEIAIAELEDTTTPDDDA
jgi:phage baseplate assembly protein W